MTMLFASNNNNNMQGGATNNNNPRPAGSFNELMNQPLPTLNGSNAHGTGQMNPADLAAANMRYINGNSMALTGPNNSSRVFGPRPNLSGLQQPSQQPAAAQSTTTMRPNYAADGGIYESLHSHVDGILLRTVQKQQQVTKDLLEERVQNRLKEDHQVQMQLWRNTLVGNRNLVDSSITQGGQPALLTNGGGGGSMIAGNAPQGLLTNGISSSPAMGKLSKEEEEAAKKHLQIIRTMGRSPHPVQFIDDLEKIATDGGYNSVWTLLKAMLPHMNNPVHGALGALDFLCCQYQRVVEDRVRSAGMNGQDVSIPMQYESPRATTAAAFVKLTVGSHASVWDIVYFCLRCGDAHAARDVVAKTQAGMADFAEEQPVLTKILGQLAGRQGQSRSMFGAGAVPVIDQLDQDAVRNFYEKTMQLAPNNKHKINVLALLSGNTMMTDESSTIEDYLFARMWPAIQDKSDPVAKITQVGTDIRRFGPSHFGADGDRAWAYGLPLMVTLQCQTALTHLAEAGGASGLMQATHVGLAFAISGVEVTDLGQAPSGGNHHRGLSSALLVLYAKLLEREKAFGLRDAVQYLLKLPTKDSQHNEIADMLYRNQDFMSYLAGEFDKKNLIRKNAYLDEYFSSQETSSILELAGRKFLREAANEEKAIGAATLFMCSGSYDVLLQLFNQKMSPPKEFTQSSNYWAGQADDFYTGFLKQHSSVKEKLLREQKMGFAETTYFLLGLRQFFNYHQNGQYREAFDVLAYLNLVPLTQAELDEKANKFRTLDPLVKNAMADTLLAAVDCLYQDYTTKKSESRGLTEAMKANFSDIRMKVRFLFLFSGATQMPGPCKIAINDVGNRMD